MSFKTVNQCAGDAALQGRVRACFAQEGGDPNASMYQIMWDVAGADDIEAAYASALAADNPDPGGDETVITDGMILAAVQANMPATP